MTLVRVNSLADESRVLARLRDLPPAADVAMGPVLDRDGLPERLLRALSAAGYGVRWLDMAALERGAAASSPSGAVSAVLSRRPSSVIVSEGVPPELAELAACLCGVRHRSISDLAISDLAISDLAISNPASTGFALSDRARAVRAPTGLVLVNPEEVAVSDVAGALSGLIGAGARIGLVYVLDPMDARFAILKSVLLGRLTCNSGFMLLSARGDPGAKAAPGRLRSTYEHGAPESNGRRQDLLVIGGHSNPLDAVLGAEAALCARSGPEEDWASLAGVYSCFVDGRCFRQPLMGRSPDDRSGLVNLDMLEASIVALSGCNAAALGGAWFNPRYGLAYQCQQSAAIASIVSAGVSLERLELDLLLVALIAEGLPLGEAVTEVNRVRAEVHGEASAYPAPTGPLVLLGNPCLELEGLELQRLPGSAEPVESSIVDLSTVRFDAERSALVRLDVAGAGRAPFILLREAPEEIWCRGVWYPVQDSARLYLWLGDVGGGDQREGRLTVACSLDDPTTPVKSAIHHGLLQIPFWMLALRQYGAEFEEAGRSRQQFDAALAALPDAVHNLTQALAVLCPDRGILVDERRMWAIATDLWQALGALSRLLLGCLGDVACHLGSLHASSWEGNLQRRDPVGPLAPCLCGNPIWGQRFSYPGESRLERTEYQCPACGPLGEDDGRRLLRLRDLPRTVEQGNPLVASLECRPGDAELAYVAAVAVIESPFRDRRLIGDVITQTVHPGENGRFELSVSVPLDLTPGLYCFAALAVLNGASCVLRQTIEVRRSPAT